MPLYEQYTDGKLSREDFLVEKKKYDEETARLEQRLHELQSRQNLQQESNQQAEKNISQLLCYANQMELTEEIKEKLIDKVKVYSYNRIEICWKFESGFLIWKLCTSTVRLVQCQQRENLFTEIGMIQKGENRLWIMKK